MIPIGSLVHVRGVGEWTVNVTGTFKGTDLERRRGKIVRVHFILTETGPFRPLAEDVELEVIEVVLDTEIEE